MPWKANGPGCPCCGPPPATPDCVCEDGPTTFTLAVITPGPYLYDDDTFTWDSPPSDLSGAPITDPEYFSDNTHEDIDGGLGRHFRYWLHCVPGAYALYPVYINETVDYGGGVIVVWTAEVGTLIYRWIDVDGDIDCDPWALTGGTENGFHGREAECSV